MNLDQLYTLHIITIYFRKILFDIIACLPRNHIITGFPISTYILLRSLCSRVQVFYVKQELPKFKLHYYENNKVLVRHEASIQDQSVGAIRGFQICHNSWAGTCAFVILTDL
jgi:hypothetical protein